MRLLIIASTMFVILLTIDIVGATPGLAPSGTAIAEYDATTGNIVVSVTGVINWFIKSASDSLTGDYALGLPAGGGLLSDGDEIIGETSGFFTMSYTDLDLGNVAQTGLPTRDLTISWNANLGVETQTLPVGYSRGSGPANYSPTAVIAAAPSVDVGVSPLSLVLDASNSLDDGVTQPLSYRWDLDNDGTFEVDTGQVSTYEIADVTSTFNGLGRFPIAVEVSDGDFFDVASSSVSLFDTIPKGPSRGPGTAPFGTAIAAYNQATGEIIVSTNNVIFWYIESESGSFTGDSLEDLPKGGGTSISWESGVSEVSSSFPMAYNNVSLTNIAPAGLPLSDLSISFRAERGQLLETLPVILFSNPEPTTLTLATIALMGLCCRRRRHSAS